MKNKNTKYYIAALLMVLVPMLFGILQWDKLPETMSTHWDLNMQANGFTNRTFAVYGLPVLMAMFYLFAVLVSNLDPKSKNQNEKVKAILFLGLPIFLVAVQIAMILINTGVQLDLAKPALLLVAFLLMVLGNYFPKTKQNYTIGIRLPWTLYSKENWIRTHRFAGYLWMAIGFVLFLLALTNWIADVLSPVVLVLLLVLLFLPMPYSAYCYYKKGGDREKLDWEEKDKNPHINS